MREHHDHQLHDDPRPRRRGDRQRDERRRAATSRSATACSSAPIAASASNPGAAAAAAVEDIRVSNIVMDGVLCPLAINLFYGCGAWGDQKVTDKSPQPVTDAHAALPPAALQQHHRAEREILPALRSWACRRCGSRTSPTTTSRSISTRDNTEAGDSRHGPGHRETLPRRDLVQERPQADHAKHRRERPGGPAVQITESADVIISDAISRTPQADAPMISLRDVTGRHRTAAKRRRDRRRFLRLLARRHATSC